MKDSVRKELKELCYYIIENNNSLARPEQLTRVQMLYERLLVLNYLEELEEEGKTIPGPALKTAPALAPKPEPKVTSRTESISKVPNATENSSSESVKKPSPSAVETPKPAAEEIKPAPQKVAAEKEIKVETTSSQSTINSEAGQSHSINDKLAKGAITVGLNDRIAFVKHLFNDSQADFNRVLSQLNTLDTYLESMYFIENLVKPDYDWENKKPYEDRLISLVKKRFGEDW
tara:strand:- start:1817 stop:2512 length:696 start_codon:yes stop_codon:yes gene_type:complete